MTANVKVEVSRKNERLEGSQRSRPVPSSVDVFAALNQPVPPEAQFGGRGGRGGRGQGGNAGAGATGGGATAGGATGGTANAAGTDRVGAGGAAAPAASAQQGASLPGGAAPGGGNRGGGQGRGGGEGQGGDRRAQLLERFKGMTADEQQAFLARLKDRGQDTTAFEAVMAKPVKSAPKPATTAAQAALLQPKYGAAQSAQTIDALFAPLPPVETRGRVWLFADNGSSRWTSARHHRRHVHGADRWRNPAEPRKS